MMVLGGGAFGRLLGHESGALTDEISALIRRDRRGEGERERGRGWERKRERKRERDTCHMMA